MNSVCLGELMKAKGYVAASFSASCKAPIIAFEKQITLKLKGR